MTELQKYDAPFYISSITWKEVTDKVAMDNAPLLEDILNEHLELSDYGTGLEHLTVIFIAVQSANTIHEEVTRYSHQKKELYIQKKLPFDLVNQYDKRQVLQLMATTYLDVLEELEDINVKNFDLHKFQADVRKLFEGQGWMVQTEKAS
jgi:hypothetical protein